MNNIIEFCYYILFILKYFLDSLFYNNKINFFYYYFFTIYKMKVVRKLFSSYKQYIYI